MKSYAPTSPQHYDVSHLKPHNSRIQGFHLGKVCAQSTNKILEVVLHGIELINDVSEMTGEWLHIFFITPP